MERSIATHNPADAGAWREARNEYRNLLVLEKASTAAGSNAAEGIISPSSLRNATINTQGRRNYARGNGDFADLARAGEAIMKPLPNSGTAPRQYMQHLITALGSGAGGMVASIPGMVAGAAAPVAVSLEPGPLAHTGSGGGTAGPRKSFARRRVISIAWSRATVARSAAMNARMHAK
jgi:hypothetical protein